MALVNWQFLKGRVKFYIEANKGLRSSAFYYHIIYNIIYLMFLDFIILFFTNQNKFYFSQFFSIIQSLGSLVYIKIAQIDAKIRKLRFKVNNPFYLCNDGNFLLFFF